MPYTDWTQTHAGSAEVLFTGMFDEPAGTDARTIPRRLISSAALNGLTTTGQVVVVSVPLPANLIVNNIAVLTGSTAAVAPTHFWLGLTDAQLNVLAVSADQGSAAIAASTLIKLPMTTSFQVQTTGLYYIAVSSSATTTAPTLTGSAPAGGVVSMSPMLCGTAGNQSAPPAVGSQLAGGVITQTSGTNIAAWIS